MKKLCKRLMIGFFAAMMSLFWAVGCSPVEVGIPEGDTLDAVKESSISASLTGTQLTVTWGAVEQATSYLVNFNDTTLTITAPTTTAVFTDVEYVSGSLTITIIARADDAVSALTTYTFTPDEEPSTDPNKLATPSGLYVNNGRLAWNEVPNATMYTVSDGKSTATVSSTGIDLAANGLTLPTTGSATYTVVAKGSGYTDSAAASYIYTAGAQTLAAVTGLAVADGKLTWNKVTNAASYTVSDGTKSVTVNTNSVNLAANGLKVPASGSVTYTVVANAEGYNSSPSAAYTYTAQALKLDSPTSFNFENGVLSWDAVKNATSYTVTDGTKTVTVKTNSIDLASNFTLSGLKQFSLVAKADGYEDSISAVYNYTDEHRHTFNMSKWENNKTHHWHDITCGHEIAIEYMGGYAVHEFGDGNVCSVCQFERNTPLVGQYVYYGEYPQTLKAENVTLGASTDSNGYYTGSDGKKYAKVTATPYAPYTWSNIKFSNDEKVVTGTDYFFKVEPIKWRVLEHKDGSSLLFCDSIIASKAYYNAEAERTIGGGTVYASNYKYSDIRTWLNGTFYSTVFSSSEQQSIQTTIVDNSAASTNLSVNQYACEDTQDRIFLLSNKEVYNTAYGFVPDGSEADTARRLLVSDYQRASGAYMNDSYAYYGYGQWWLRSPIWDVATEADICTPSGTVMGVNVTDVKVGIAPAMRVATSAIW